MSVDMTMDRRAMAPEIRTKDAHGPVIAGTLAAVTVLAVPTSMIELATASAGLSELVPALAPPIAWPFHLALALGAGGVASVLALTMRRVAEPSEQRETAMPWTQDPGRHALAGIGGDGETGPPYDSPLIDMPRIAGQSDSALQRRRADMHPDAPPRAPIIASRDLPNIFNLLPVDPETDSAVQFIPLTLRGSPVRDTTGAARPRPLPCSPEPFSDADLAAMRARLAAPAPVVACPVAQVETPVVDTPLDAPLDILIARFEQGVGRRIAMRDAADALTRVETAHSEMAAFVTGNMVVNDVRSDAPRADPAPRPDLDGALCDALETLRKLSSRVR
jgi:hypothetical protein